MLHEDESSSSNSYHHSFSNQFRSYKIEFVSGPYKHNAAVARLLIPCTLPVITLSGMTSVFFFSKTRYRFYVYVIMRFTSFEWYEHLGLLCVTVPRLQSDIQFHVFRFLFALRIPLGLLFVCDVLL